MGVRKNRERAVFPFARRVFACHDELPRQGQVTLHINQVISDFVWDRAWEGALAGTSTKVLCLAATTSVSYAGVGYWLVRIRETP